MTYRCGIGPRLGLPEGPPHVFCDAPGCTAKFEAVEARGGGPPAWLRNGTAPPGWRTIRRGEHRIDYCPEHKMQVATEAER